MFLLSLALDVLLEIQYSPCKSEINFLTFFDIAMKRYCYTFFKCKNALPKCILAKTMTSVTTEAVF